MPIKFRLSLILEAILEVEERVFIEHVKDLNHKGSEVVDVVADAAHLLKSTKVCSHFLLCIAWGKMLT